MSKPSATSRYTTRNERVVAALLILCGLQTIFVEQQKKKATNFSRNFSTESNTYNLVV